MGVSHISTKEHQINEEIRVPEVRLIGADGEQLGIVNIDKAQQISIDSGLDLVMIAPQATPPVCRVMDYGKFRFEQEKREKESKKKQQVIEVKEIQLTCNIGDHDFETKASHAKRFLKEGNKV
ncbi:MAG: translation initiation factor IF-3, partial [Thermoguttaceae bacterium]|nr:translation initiation factor IF-3 [Thermoguttaceae bacterium]